MGQRVLFILHSPYATLCKRWCCSVVFVQQRQFFHLLCELLQTDGGLPSMAGSVNITQIHSGRMRAQ